MKKIIDTLSEHNLPTVNDRLGKRIFSSNENVYGCSKKVKNIKKININYNNYPDDNCLNLREKISSKLNIKPENVLIGNGSGEILQIISRSFLSAGDEVITCVPTYPYYFVETVIEDGSFKSVPLKNNKFDIDGIINSITNKTKIIYITNPNNPTGTIITEAEMKKLIDKVRKDILIVSDEAYYEYVVDNKFPNNIEKIKNNNNLCVLRTFSKAYGLAAMRVGYLIGSEKLISGFNKVRLTFNVSEFSQLLACVAFDDQKFIDKCKQKNFLVKKYLYECLDELKIKYIKSETNFVLIKNQNDIFQLLKDNKIVSKLYCINNESYIRLTIGNKKDINRIIKIIKKNFD